MDLVIQAIKEADLGENCCKMLVAACPHALGVTADKRHESQEIVVRMIGDVLKSNREKLEKEVELEKENTKEFDAKLAELTDVQDKATEVVNSTKASQTSKQAELKACKESVETAKKDLAEKKTEAKKSNATFVKAEEMKNKYEKAKEEHLEVMVLGQADDLATHQKALEPIFDELELDDSLRGALPSTCGKKKVDRASFDNLVVEQIVAVFTAKLETIQKEYAELVPAARERDDIVEKAEKVLAEAEAQLVTITEELAASKTAANDAKEEMNKAIDAVFEYQTVFHKATATREAKIMELDNLVTLTITTYEELKNKSSVQAAVEGGA